MPVTSAVDARDLVVRYGDNTALDRSTFSIPAGTITAVIGPNGSGKSTLLNAIAGLVDPAGGDIEVPARADGARRISYVLQTTKVNESLPVSVREVVTMGRYAELGAYGWLAAEDRNEIAAAMERTGITDLASRQLHELSGGQRQRVFVAQGMAQSHDLLLLDEPLTGIDMTTARAIDEAIHAERSRGCTVILTTHDLSEAQVADHVVLLAGRVVASGPPGEVLTVANLKDAYGPSVLHLDEGSFFIDDAAHAPVDERHVHRERSIHTEASQTDTHSSG
ncbi:MAG: metal ABC transporter ATP-binding protein [Acidimicrobiia bacterium]|nr:metal ABC transporter ATP-binding protein [Acidimicrobiia bacterium]